MATSTCTWSDYARDDVGCSCRGRGGRATPGGVAEAATIGATAGSATKPVPGVGFLGYSVSLLVWAVVRAFVVSLMVRFRVGYWAHREADPVGVAGPGVVRGQLVFRAGAEGLCLFHQ